MKKLTIPCLVAVVAATAYLWYDADAPRRTRASASPVGASASGPSAPFTALLSPGDAALSRQPGRVDAAGHAKHAKHGPPPELVDVPSLAEREQWAELYREATLGQVTDELTLLDQVLSEGTAEYYEKSFATGAYVVEGGYEPGQPYTLPPDDQDLLCSRRFTTGGVVTKVVLPRGEFPEMYRIKRQISWLLGREMDLRAISEGYAGG